MKLNCTIDDTNYVMTVNASKPLSLILQEVLDSFANNNKCVGANCGNCVVLINGVCSLSCLVPAFKLNNAVIQTYESFSKTRNCHDIERAYAETGIKPCRQCYASKTILIESLLQKLDERKPSGKLPFSKKNESIFNSELIAQELGINACKCLDYTQLTRVIVLAHQYRSQRRGKV